MVAFLLLLNCGAEPQLNHFLARQDYPAATAYYLNQLRRQPRNPPTLKNLARVYDHWHRYDSSLYYWEKALNLKPDDDSAIVGRWQALYYLHQKDSIQLDSVKRLIAWEARQGFFIDTTYRHLLLAYTGFQLGGDSVRAHQAFSVLALKYPDSAPVHELIGSTFYDSLYPVLNNDTAKVLLISQFLVRYPKTEWRQTFYFYLLSALYSLNDTIGLTHYAEQMIKEDTLDPFRYRYAAALFNRMKLRPEIAERYARRALELTPKAVKPKNKPQEQWQLEYPPLDGMCRAALAEALILQQRAREAIPILLTAIRQFRWDPENEFTPAPFWCLLGDAYSLIREPDSARIYYLTAITLGDSRNYWSARADTALQKLKFSPPVQLQLARELLGYTGPVFTDVTDSVGLAEHREYRVAWGDYNNDGYEDLLLNGCRLFRNDSGRYFTEVTEPAGLSGILGRGGIFADFNNDYWLDLYVCGADTQDFLLLNQFGRFHNATESLGNPSDPYPTEGCAASDFDLDGWLDLYCANYENWEKHRYYPDRLYHNQGGGFKEIGARAGTIPPYNEPLAGRGVNWGDYDDDGYPDCYVSNYRLCQNLLWHNNRNSTFTNLAPKLGVAGYEVSGWFGHTIGSVWADYDNDRDLDLFCANLAHPRYIHFSNRSMFYENRGAKAQPRFLDRRSELGIRYEETHSDPAFADIDNDGDLDLYLTSVYENRRSFLYLNQLVSSPGKKGWETLFGNYKFIEATYLSGTRVFNGWGCAFADYDNDGDLDLIVGSGSGLRLFRNDTKNQNHWLKVKVIGTKHNASGIGARVTVIQGRKKYIREIEGGKGTTSQNSLIAHFGLGSSPGPVTIQVRFGPNSTLTLKNVEPDRLVVITEP